MSDINYLIKSFQQNLMQLDEKTSDVSVTVGEKPNEQTFSAHVAILVAHSTYFEEVLSDAWTKREPNKIVTFEKSNITPKIFEILMKYFYSGKIDLQSHDLTTTIAILVAADELLVDDLVLHIQLYMQERHVEAMLKNFATIHQLAFSHNKFVKLQQFCDDAIKLQPTEIFNSVDFTQLKKPIFIQLIKRGDLHVKEIEIWKKVIKWGIAQSAEINNTLPITQWTHNEFDRLYSILHDCLPHIRFFHINSPDFYYHVKPYSQLLSQTFYQTLYQYYLKPGGQDDLKYQYSFRGV